MTRRYGPRIVGYGILLALVIAAPHVIPEQKVTDTQLSYVGTFAIALLGLVVLTGWTGQISLGHGAFMAIGAYVTAILSVDHGVPDLLTLPAAGLVAGIAIARSSGRHHLSANTDPTSACVKPHSSSSTSVSGRACCADFRSIAR